MTYITFTDLLIFFVSAINIIIGIIVLLKNYKDLKHIYLSLFIFSIVGWNIAVSFEGVLADEFWVKNTFIFATIAFITFTLFIRQFFIKYTKSNKTILYIIILIGVVFILISNTNLIVTDLSVVSNIYYHTVSFGIGPLFIYAASDPSVTAVLSSAGRLHLSSMISH